MYLELEGGAKRVPWLVEDPVFVLVKEADGMLKLDRSNELYCLRRWIFTSGGSWGDYELTMEGSMIEGTDWGYVRMIKLLP